MRIVGRPFGGVRPRRLYDIVGRRAYRSPAYRWVANRWGEQLHLSPHYHIDRNIMVFGTYDLQLHWAMRSLIRPGMVCVDAGANLGEMAPQMARLTGPTGKVLAFEPVPHVHRRLVEHVDRNGLAEIVDCRAAALTDRSGTMTMNIPDETADNQGMGSVVATRGCTTVTEVEEDGESKTATLMVSFIDGLLPVILGYRDKVLVESPSELVEKTKSALVLLAGAADES